MKWISAKVAAIALLMLVMMPAAEAQYRPGGRATIAVTTSSARAALPADRSLYPAVLITPIVASTQQTYYAIGDGTVAATTSSFALPPGGICITVGTGTTQSNIAVIGAGATTVFITQFQNCPPFS